MKVDSAINGPKMAPYGSWKSPITADFVTSQVVGLSEVQLVGGDVYWLEHRPSEQGRSVVVKQTSDGVRVDLVPAGFNARSRVHEYGGGSYLAAGDVVYFSNYADNKLYSVQPGQDPLPVVDDSYSFRYANFIFDEARSRLISVAELHTEGMSEPVNSLIAIGLTDGLVTTLVDGADFYASPCLSPDGSQLVWLSWNHPNMPWDGTELWVAPILPDGSIGCAEFAAGGIEESIFQPQWSPDGLLYYVSDRNGWWNIYRQLDRAAEDLWVKDAEFGEPQWVFGQSTYAFSGVESVICSYTHDGTWNLASIDQASLKVTEIEVAYSAISSVRANERYCAFVGASPGEMPAVILLDLTIGKYTTLKRSSEAEVPDQYLSIAEPIQFPTADGGVAYGNYYPPKNDDFVPSDNELPPLLVACHGGPTSTSPRQLNLTVQYWTSRGFAFVHVNYGGSTGYGRSYQERLKGNWGIVDVDDCVDCALYLTDVGKADGDRLTIHGGSAGGYTALCALTFHEVFAAGASLYGVSDLEALVRDTHKFESRYLDGLIGPYPQDRETYVARSPIHFVEKLSAPIIFFQGLEDKVVPPDQASLMVAALKNQNIPVAYIAFEGEGHGFRKSESISRYLESHLNFYARIFGIELADNIRPVPIEGTV